MKKSKLTPIIIFSIILLALPTLLSLQIEDGTVFTTNKTYNVDKKIKFQLHNPKNFAFYNITFEDNDFIEMDKIDTLNPGSKVNVTATITSNEDLSNKKIKIQGVYESEIGESNETHIIEVVSLEDGLSPCDKAIYKGDTIKWVNFVDDDVILKDKNGDNIAEIDANKSHSQTFTQETEFDYNAKVPIYGSLGDNQMCKISVLDTEGYVHNPNYDIEITLNTEVLYEQTNISVTQLTNSYEVTYDSETEDVFNIKNTGDKVAKNINLEGDWLSFSPNNFDLEPGESRNIQYTIKPQVTSSNETDKTYDKEVKVTGNFPTETLNFSIFVEYASIVRNGEQGGRTTEEILIDYLSLIEERCSEEENRDTQLCKDFEQKIIYQGGNNSGYFNVTYSQEEVKENKKAFYELSNMMEEYIKADKKSDERFNQSINQINNKTKQTSSEISQVKNEFRDTNETWNFISLFIITAVIGLLGFAVWDKLKSKRDAYKVESF